MPSLVSKISNLFFSGGSSFVVGISIGTSSIKIVELGRKGKSWKLVHFGIVQLPEDVIVNREIINPVVVSNSIKTLINQIKLKTKFVCTSISGTSIMIKRMSLEIKNAKEIQDQIFWEAEQYLPFDVSEVVMDYQVLSRAKDGKTEVILVAAKRAVLESYISCVEDAGLKVKIIDTDFFALQNLYEANYPPSQSEAVAIVDIGSSSMKIVVVSGGVPVFTKDCSIGGNNLTSEIQKNLGLSYVDAETLKISGGPDGKIPSEISDLMGIISENFISEIKKSLDFYSASASSAPVSYVLLCGGSSKIPGLSKSVEDSLNLPTQLINPFNAISYDPSVFNQEYLSNIAPIAAVPIGLALRVGAE